MQFDEYRKRRTGGKFSCWELQSGADYQPLFSNQSGLFLGAFIVCTFVGSAFAGSALIGPAFIDPAFVVAGVSAITSVFADSYLLQLAILINIAWPIVILRLCGRSLTRLRAGVLGER